MNMGAWFGCHKSDLDSEMIMVAYIFIWLPFLPSGIASSVSRSTPS